MKLAELTRKAAKLAIDNSPTILTAMGVVGSISTAYLASKATYQVSETITLAIVNSKEPPVTPKEKLEFVREYGLWKLYIPSILTGAASVFCIISANQIGNKRAAALAAAYSLSERGLEEYKNKVVEKFGERKEEAVRAEVAQDRINESWTEGVEVHGLPRGELCYDKYSDRYFWGTVEDIRKAENDINFVLLHEGYASLNAFYELLGLPYAPFAEEVGWKNTEFLDVRITSALTPTDKPCLAIDFKVEPVRDYHRFR